MTACKGDDTEDPVQVDTTPVVHSDFPSKPPKGCGTAFMSYHYGDAYKTLREVEEYRVGKSKRYVRELSDRRNEYLLAGISPSFRRDWLSSHKIEEKDQQCLVPLFDAIGAAAKVTLPKFHPRGYIHHESGEDKIIKNAIKEELPDAEFIHVGVSSPQWNIEKLYNGLPSQRYKYGMAWVKSKTFDDGYCRIMYVNIVQDYTGGGNYGESRGNYISKEPAGCEK
ncbi:MAG: hypothetical protein JNK82_15135 [Myxococcaceae bacterium]|nr:hypothetical protein [Myxococcaceae bacterium]